MPTHQQFEPDSGDPENVNLRKGQRFVAPRTPSEKQLAEIWRNVLGVKEIGIYDNFLELGGHSILVAQCINRVRDAFQVDLSPSSLFAETANVRELAEAIDKLRNSEKR